MGKDSITIQNKKKERNQLKAELLRVPLKENYIEYVKIERKIIKIEKEIQVIVVTIKKNVCSIARVLTIFFRLTGRKPVLIKSFCVHLPTTLLKIYINKLSTTQEFWKISFAGSYE